MRSFAKYCCIAFVVIIAILMIEGVAADSNPSPHNYALRPTIEVVNWGGNSMKIRFPYQDYKYTLDYSNPYEYIKTDVGYDLVVHFSRLEKGEN